MSDPQYAVPTRMKVLFRMADVTFSPEASLYPPSRLFADGVADRALAGSADGAFAGTAEQAATPTPEQQSARVAAFAHSRLPEPLVAFLLEMDAKLDAILGHLQRENLEKDFPHEGMVTHISAESLMLECKEPLAPGDELELMLVFSEFPLQAASCLVKVEALSPEQAHSGHRGVFALSYVRLGPDVREAIIRHVFQETRRMIRAARDEEE